VGTKACASRWSQWREGTLQVLSTR